MDDLSNEQTELLLQFQDLSGIEDLERCKILLVNHSWNIESAVRDTFEEESVEQVADNEIDSQWHENSTSSIQYNRMPLVNLHPREQRVFRFIRHPVGILGWGYWIITYPIHFLWSKFFSILRYIFQFLRSNQRAILSTPMQDVIDFINNFEKEYGVFHVNFLRLTYAQALNEAKRELKFLLVYLHSPHHQDTQLFCREVLCSQDIINFFGDRILVWGCCINKPEGYKVSQALRETTYPFMSLIVLKLNKMTSVARIEGLINEESLMEKLTELMVEHQASLVTARLDREERNYNVTLRQQQDEAYQQSLLADRDRERRDREKKAEEQEKEFNIVKKRKEEEERIRKASEIVEAEKEEARLRLCQEPPIDAPDSIRIMLKLPTGIRLERRFKMSDPITLLHDFVFVHESAPDNFEVVRNMPRQVITCHPTSQPIILQNNAQVQHIYNSNKPDVILDSQKSSQSHTNHLISSGRLNSIKLLDDSDVLSIDESNKKNNRKPMDDNEKLFDEENNSLLSLNSFTDALFTCHSNVDKNLTIKTFNSDNNEIINSQMTSVYTNVDSLNICDKPVINGFNSHCEYDESSLSKINNECGNIKINEIDPVTNNAKFSDFGFNKSELLYIHDLDA